ncbi:serine hydrolase domain-containing protein [Nocardia albiluteola]|uniref:serine hydrolase domain-containing protein n=1 Tax=Nocardia albiluteola TaxID=2842303 RepID=UPI0027E1545C|nr:serine hydrolase domain-containing protein [Nocardia albiluteola]
MRTAARWWTFGGGTADPATGRRWERGTVAAVYSATKGVIAASAHLLVERGQLDLDAPVARYWPGFAAADKGEISVRSECDRGPGCCQRPHCLHADAGRATGDNRSSPHSGRPPREPHRQLR